MKLVLELRDEGYPGPTYDLIDNPNDETSEGIHLQA